MVHDVEASIHCNAFGDKQEDMRQQFGIPGSMATCTTIYLASLPAIFAKLGQHCLFLGIGNGATTSSKAVALCKEEKTGLEQRGGVGRGGGRGEEGQEGGGRDGGRLRLLSNLSSKLMEPSVSLQTAWDGHRGKSQDNNQSLNTSARVNRLLS